MTLPGTTSGMKHVRFFRHALALDERRVKFLPEYAYEGTMPTAEERRQTEADQHMEARVGQISIPTQENDTHSSSLQDEESDGPSIPLRSDPPPHSKEVWFAGTHSDM